MESETISLRALHPSDDRSALQDVLSSAPGYFERMTGRPPSEEAAEELFRGLPEGCSFEDKIVFGIFRARTMIGCIDLIRGYPRPNTATLGLLLVVERHQRQGMGRAAYGHLESFARTLPGCDRIRLGVVSSNLSVLPFWQSHGFFTTGETAPYRGGMHPAQVVILEKALTSQRS